MCNKSDLKVIYLTNIPAPYRVDFFNLLSKKCLLNVVFYEKRIKSFGWKETKKDEDYNSRYLNTKSNKFWVFSYLKYLRENRDALFVVGGYSLIPEIIAIFYLNFLKVDFALSLDGGFVRKGLFKEVFKKILIKKAKYYLSSGVNTTKTFLNYGADKKSIREYHFTSTEKKDTLKTPISFDVKRQLRVGLGLNQDAFFIVYVGQMISRKGVDVLINALSELDSRIELIMVGDGEMLEDLKKQTSKYEIDERVHFFGRQPKDKVLNILRISDVFVLPAREDIWGLVLNEAIASGLPVLATYQTGAAYSLIEKEKNGYMYDCDDVKDLVCLIKKIKNENLNEFSKKSLEIASNYTLEQMCDDYLSLFKEMKDKKELRKI